MPVILNAGFVDLRILTFTLDSPITLHYFVRRQPKTTNPTILFLLRELDTKILRVDSDSLDVNSRGEQVIRTIINEQCKSHLQFASLPELRLLKSLGLISPRAPRVALIEPATVIRILRHFNHDIKALILEAVLLTLLTESRFLKQVLLTAKGAVYHANYTQQISHDDETSHNLLSEVVTDRFGSYYPPPWHDYFATKESPKVPLLDGFSTVLLDAEISNYKKDLVPTAWCSLITPTAAPAPNDLSLNSPPLDHTTSSTLDSNSTTTFTAPTTISQSSTQFINSDLHSYSQVAKNSWSENNRRIYTTELIPTNPRSALSTPNSPQSQINNTPSQSSLSSQESQQLGQDLGSNSLAPSSPSLHTPSQLCPRSGNPYSQSPPQGLDSDDDSLECLLDKLSLKTIVTHDAPTATTDAILSYNLQDSSHSARNFLDTIISDWLDSDKHLAAARDDFVQKMIKVMQYELMRDCPPVSALHISLNNTNSPQIKPGAEQPASRSPHLSNAIAQSPKQLLSTHFGPDYSSTEPLSFHISRQQHRKLNQSPLNSSILPIPYQSSFPSSSKAAPETIQLAPHVPGLNWLLLRFQPAIKKRWDMCPESLLAAYPRSLLTRQQKNLQRLHEEFFVAVSAPLSSPLPVSTPVGKQLKKNKSGTLNNGTSSTTVTIANNDDQHDEQPHFQQIRTKPQSYQQLSSTFQQTNSIYALNEKVHFQFLNMLFMPALPSYTPDGPFRSWPVEFFIPVPQNPNCEFCRLQYENHLTRYKDLNFDLMRFVQEKYAFEMPCLCDVRHHRHLSRYLELGNPRLNQVFLDTGTIPSSSRLSPALPTMTPVTSAPQLTTLQQKDGEEIEKDEQQQHDASDQSPPRDNQLSLFPKLQETISRLFSADPFSQNYSYFAPISPSPNQLTTPATQSIQDTSDPTTVNSHPHDEIGLMSQSQLKFGPDYFNSAFLGDFSLLTYPSTIAFSTLLTLATIYYRNRNPFVPSDHLGSDDEILSERQQYQSKILIESTIWLIQALKYPIVYSSGLVEFSDSTIIQSLYPDKVAPALFICPDIPLDEFRDGGIYGSKGQQQEGMVGEDHKSNDIDDLLYQSLVDSFTNTVREEHGAIVIDDAFIDLGGPNPPNKYLDSLGLADGSFGLDGIDTDTTAATAAAAATTTTTHHSSISSTSTSSSSIDQALALFPYTITPSNLALFRSFVYHIDILSPAHKLRLFRHAGMVFPVENNDVVVDSEGTPINLARYYINTIQSLSPNARVPSQTIAAEIAASPVTLNEPQNEGDVVDPDEDDGYNVKRSKPNENSQQSLASQLLSHEQSGNEDGNVDHVDGAPPSRPERKKTTRGRKSLQHHLEHGTQPDWARSKLRKLRAEAAAIAAETNALVEIQNGIVVANNPIDLNALVQLNPNHNISAHHPMLLVNDNHSLNNNPNNNLSFHNQSQQLSTDSSAAYNDNTTMHDWNGGAPSLPVTMGSDCPPTNYYYNTASASSSNTAIGEETDTTPAMLSHPITQDEFDQLYGEGIQHRFTSFYWRPESLQYHSSSATVVFSSVGPSSTAEQQQQDYLLSGLSDNHNQQQQHQPNEPFSQLPYSPQPPLLCGNPMWEHDNGTDPIPQPLPLHTPSMGPAPFYLGIESPQYGINHTLPPPVWGRNTSNNTNTNNNNIDSNTVNLGQTTPQMLGNALNSPQFKPITTPNHLQMTPLMQRNGTLSQGTNNNDNQQDDQSIDFSTFIKATLPYEMLPRGAYSP